MKSYRGFDNIYLNHLRYASNCFISILTLFFNSCLRHSYLPSGITNAVITPLIKDKFGDMSCLNNYRPIVKSSVFLKLFEYILLSKIEKYLISNDRQHGFKKNYSTTSACFILKETIFSYLNCGTPVYAAFLDLSKSFDNVPYSESNHLTLERRD